MFPTAIVLVALAAPPATPAEAFRRAEELYAADEFGEAEPLFRAALASDEPYLKRRAYTRLMNLYARSGRPDKAIKLAEHYDPSDRVGALAFLQERQARGEIVTGLLFVDPAAEDLHDTLGTVAAPLNSLNDEELTPGSAVLETLNAGWR